MGIEKHVIGSVFLVSVTFASQTFAADSHCADLTSKGEDLVRAGKFSEAKPILEKATKSCLEIKAKSARSFIALGKVHFQNKQYQLAIAQFEEALRQEPELPLAYMNIGAAYEEMGNHQKAFDYSKKAAMSGDKWVAPIANHNAGLALFRIAADNSDLQDRRSEPYFKKAIEGMPENGENYFFLGILQEVSYNNNKAASDYYKKGCDRGHAASCKNLEKIKSVAEREEKVDEQQNPTEEPSDENEQMAEEERERAERQRVPAAITIPPSEAKQFAEYEKLLQANRGRTPAQARKKANAVWKAFDSYTSPEERKAAIEFNLDDARKPVPKSE